MERDRRVIAFPRIGSHRAMRHAAPTDDRVSCEAIGWLIQLQEDPDDSQLRARIDLWLANDPTHRAAWAFHTRTYAIMGNAPAELEEQWRGARREPVRGTMVSWHSPRALLALAVAACIAILIAPTLILRIQADRVTGTAQIASVGLPDGSTVTLAPDSAIRITYSEARREVRLLAGEAFFDVRRDAARPFSVLSGEAKAVVLGTAFDVLLREEGARVAVRRGHVRVERQTGDISGAQNLRPGQWTDLSWSGAVSRGSHNPALAGAWRDRRLMFDDRPIAEALEDLRPWFSGGIILANADLGARRVTATVDPGDPAEAVRSLVSTYGGSVRRITPWLLVVS